MKILILALMISLSGTFLMANDIEKNDASFEKWGKEYQVGAPILKAISKFFTEGNESYRKQYGDEVFLGIMGVADWELESRISFLKGKTVEDLAVSDLNIRVAAYNLAKCVRSFQRTPIAVRCYSELIAQEESIEMAKLFPKVTLQVDPK